MSDYETTQRRRDLIVGLFVCSGLVAFTWLVFKFGDLPSTVSQFRSFRVYVQFPSAPGVQKDTPVRFCGYQIGSVTRVQPPAPRKDLVTGQTYHQTLAVLSINKRYTQIPFNVQVKLMTRGLGSSYIEFKLDPETLPAPTDDPNRTETTVLAQDSLLQGSTSTGSILPEELQNKLDALIGDVQTFVANANDIIGDRENKENIKATLANLAVATKQATGAIKRAEDMMAEVQKTLAEFSRLAKAGTEAVKNVDAQAEKLVTSIAGTSEELSEAAQQLRLVLAQINSGDGSLGRLVYDASLYESILESSDQLQILMEKFRLLLEKITEEGLRSVY